MVYPLMADSIDSLMYQKYDEKSSRINEIWTYKGDKSLDVSDIDPETLKFDLIKDPAKKANFIVGQKRDKIRADRRIEEARYDVLYKDIQNYERAEEKLPVYRRDMDEAEAEVQEARKSRDKAKKALEKLEKNGASTPAIMAAKRELDSAKYDLERAESSFRNEKKAWKEYKDLSDSCQAKFRKMDIKPGKEEAKLKEIAAGIQKLRDQEAAIDESYKDELKKAERELAAARIKLPSLSEMIDGNVNSIMGDLRPMDEVKKEIIAEREAKMKKSLVIAANNRIYLKVS
jgi:DNA repair exonuclease SbcCD ATPase subunit